MILLHQELNAYLLIIFSFTDEGNIVLFNTCQMNASCHGLTTHIHHTYDGHSSSPIHISNCCNIKYNMMDKNSDIYSTTLTFIPKHLTSHTKYVCTWPISVHKTYIYIQNSNDEFYDENDIHNALCLVYIYRYCIHINVWNWGELEGVAKVTIYSHNHINIELSRKCSSYTGHLFIDKCVVLVVVVVGSHIYNAAVWEYRERDFIFILWLVGTLVELQLRFRLLCLHFHSNCCHTYGVQTPLQFYNP